VAFGDNGVPIFIIKIIPWRGIDFLS